MKKINFSSFAATVVSLGICVFNTSCESGETLKVKAKGGETVIVTKNYETNLVTNVSVNNNGVSSTGNITEIGTITSNVDDEEPLEYTFNPSASAVVTLAYEEVTVSAENAGFVEITSESTPTTQENSTEDKISFSSKKTFSFSDGQNADAVYDFMYENVESTVSIPHAEVDSVIYKDYSVLQLTDSTYQVTLHFAAYYSSRGIKTPIQGSMDLYPVYIQKVPQVGPSTPDTPIYTYDISVEYWNEDNGDSMDRWGIFTLTRSDGKKFADAFPIASTGKITGFDLYVKEAKVSEMERTEWDDDDATKLERGNFIAGVKNQKVHWWRYRTGFINEIGGGTIWGDNAIGLRLWTITFTDPETGYTKTWEATGSVKIVKDGFDVKADKVGKTVTNSGVKRTYASTYELGLEVTVDGELFHTTTASYDIYTQQ